MTELTLEQLKSQVEFLTHKLAVSKATINDLIELNISFKTESDLLKARFKEAFAQSEEKIDELQVEPELEG